MKSAFRVSMLVVVAAGLGPAMAAAEPALLPPQAAAVALSRQESVLVVDPNACQEVDPYASQLLSVRINGSNPKLTLVVLRRKCGGLLVRTTDLNALRVKTDQQPQVSINDLNYVNILNFPGIVATVNEARQLLTLEGEPWVFYSTVVDFEPRSRGPVDQAAYGAYLNYGAGVQGSLDGGQAGLSGTARLGLFAPLGQLTSDWLMRSNSGQTDVVRIATTATHDFYGSRTTLRVGDIFPRSSQWGGAPALGGIQYGSNYSVDPYRSVSAAFGLSTELRRISTLFFTSTALQDNADIREAARGTAIPIPYGPLDVINVPSPLSGVFRMSVLGDDGSRQDFDRQFFFNPSLLREETQDFSYELGWIRQQGNGDKYSQLLASGLHRYGFTNWLTGEAHGELGRRGVALGLTGIVDIQPLGTLSATFAGTQHQGQPDTGLLGIARWQKEYARINYRLGYEAQSDDYLLPAAALARNLFRDAFTADVSVSLLDRHVVGLQFQQGEQRTATGGALNRSVSATYGIHLGVWGNIGVTGRRVLRPENDYEVALFCTFPLFSSQSLRQAPEFYESFSDDTSNQAATVSFQGSHAEGDVSRGVVAADYQWTRRQDSLRLQLQRGVLNDERTGIFAAYGNRRFDAFAGVSGINSDLSQYSMGVSSALIWIGNELFQTNQVANSFALVQLGQTFAGARVNGIASDDEGNVLLQNVTSYVENPLVVPGSDLPSNAQIDRVPIVKPPFRAGVIVQYPVRLIREALITVMLRGDPGETLPLPMGAGVTVEGREEIYPVGSKGLIYLTELSSRNTVNILWRQQSCTIAVNVPEDVPADTIVELGPFVCEGVKP